MVMTCPARETTMRWRAAGAGVAQPVEALVSDVVLQPHDPRGSQVSGVCRHPRQGHGVFAIHPVALALVDLDLVLVAARVGSGELVEFHFPVARDLVAVVGRVVAAHVQREG